MIIVRDIFHLKFGEAKQATALLNEGRDALTKAGYPVDRILADVTGEYYTLVMESRVENLAQFEEALGKSSGVKEWQDVFRRLVPLVHSGRREILRVVQ
jgi:hypothetical protein